MPNHIQKADISLKHRILSGSVWVFLGKILTACTGLAIIALLTRLLNPSEMGTYFLIFSTVSFFALIGQLGMNSAIVRLVAESMGMNKPGRAREVIRIVFYSAGVGVLVVSSSFYLGFGKWIALNIFESSLMVSIIGVSTIWIIVMVFNNLVSETFRGFAEIHLATVFGGLTTGLFSVSFFIVLRIIYRESNLSQIIILTIIAWCISLLISAILLNKKIKKLEGNDNNNIANKEILNIAWPLLATAIMLFTLNSADIWIIGSYQTQEEVAVYGAMKKIVNMVSIPLLIINAVVPPLIAELNVVGEIKKLEKVLRSAATIAGLPAIIVLVIFIVFGSQLIQILYGDFYCSGLGVLILLSIGQLASVLTGPCGISLMMTGFQKTMMNITIFCAVLNIIGAICASKYFGLIGVASVVAFAKISQNILMLYFVRKKVGIWTQMQLSFKNLKKMP